MANTQTDNSKDLNQNGVQNVNKENQQQKKGFEQGNGNNSTTADPKKMDENTGVKQENEKGKQGQGTLNSNDQSKLNNEDSTITNKDESMKRDPEARTEINDDEDVDENSQLEGYKEEQEMDDEQETETEEEGEQTPKMGSSL